MGLLRSTLSSGHNFVGAESFASWQPGRSFLSHYHSDAYASAYPSIRAIANEYMTVRPYAINANGEPVSHPVINALYHPNQDDSSVAFAEKIAVSTLVHRKTYILVWRREGREAKPGGDFTAPSAQIAGFTFLEFPGVTRRNGKTYYNIGSQEFDESEVLVLPGGVDANNLYEGYSPTEASRRWATLDDYIADFQAGFFENGAVPTGQFIITAKSTKDFDDIVDTLQSRHRGARNNNNVTYAHRPIDPTTNKPAQAQIEWVPFSQTNKDIDFKNLFEQANKRIDVSYGVSQFIKGVDDSPNYATAQVSEKNFCKRAVYPLLLRNYTQITHELNRITNGLGVAITFDYDIPTVADEEKVEAETNNIRIDTVLKLVEKGYSLDSAVDALKLPNNFKLLEKGDGKPKIDNDKPDVDEGGEVVASPDPDKIDGVTPVNRDEAAKRTNPKVKNEISETDRAYYENQLSDVVRKHMQVQIDKAIEDSRAQNAQNQTEDDEAEEEDEFTDDMLLVIVALLIAQGAIEYAAGEKMLTEAGISTEGLTAFVLTAETQESYKKYLNKVAASYSDDTASAIRSVLARAGAEGWTQTELEQNLQSIMQTDEWRVKRLATSEVNRAQSLSGVEAMKQVQNEVGVTIEKSLKHGGGDKPCEFCAVLLDRWVRVDETFVDLNEVIVGENGGLYINDFSANDGFDIHPNGHCTSEFRVVVDEPAKASNSLPRHYVDASGSMVDLDLRCTDCSRFLNLKEVCTMIGRVRCPVAKCKALNNIKVVNTQSSEHDIRFVFAPTS